MEFARTIIFAFKKGEFFPFGVFFFGFYCMIFFIACKGLFACFV
jgi:hypothetical protein